MNLKIHYYFSLFPFKMFISSPTPMYQQERKALIGKQIGLFCIFDLTGRGASIKCF
jgi:hypothetical protein